MKEKQVYESNPKLSAQYSTFNMFSNINLFRCFIIYLAENEVAMDQGSLSNIYRSSTLQFIIFVHRLTFIVWGCGYKFNPKSNNNNNMNYFNPYRLWFTFSYLIYWLKISFIDSILLRYHLLPFPFFFLPFHIIIIVISFYQWNKWKKEKCIFDCIENPIENQFLFVLLYFCEHLNWKKNEEKFWWSGHCLALVGRV